MRTAKKMGIKTVAVYSEPDAHARHVESADEAVFVGPAASADSYLRIDKIVAACKKTGASIVHPGYGFLSENASFVSALNEAGVTFCGPSTESMALMGDKIESKKIAKAANVNIIPGFIGEIETVNDCLRVCHDIGYPVMMKASAGGGGKGMRVAWNDAEAKEGFILAKSEAQRAFGDDRMLIEKFIHNPRHVEIQILADSFGKTLYLNERECSIQRRNQKVIEEAPSPFLDPETRKMMGEQACALAKAVGYKSAGTVEMLIDSNRQFYFLEMNTRLQVEHPITEFITGQDIVEHMINIAAGKPLPISQEDLTPRGWATEARIYAEDPLKGFLPSHGRLTGYKEPPSFVTIPSGEDVAVRCDTGFVEGSQIQVFYDPLIAKLITYGSDRNASIEGMKRALDQFIIRGFPNNVNFLRALCDHPRYVSGNITTAFIPEEYPKGFHGIDLSPLQKAQLQTIASVVYMTEREDNGSISGQTRSSTASMPYDAAVYVRVGPDSAFSNATDGFARVLLRDTESEDSIEVDIDGETSVFVHENCHDTMWSGRLNDSDFTTQFIRKLDTGYLFQHCGSNFPVKVLSEEEFALSHHMPKKIVKDMSNFLISPMPGSVLEVFVKPGDHVEAGAKLLLLEAMKMQNVLYAERDAIVKTVSAKPGHFVSVDALLIEFEK